MDAISYIVKQILDKNCTVVLGAGISYSSDGLEGNHHYVEKMKENLFKYSNLDSKTTLSYICQQYLWEKIQHLEKLNHIKNLKRKNKIISKLAQNKLVSSLYIHKFLYLSPSPAHYYIAFLAREGLISEIITTNYDCNMENAYLAVTTKENLKSTNQDNSTVIRIYNNKTFSKFASKKTTKEKIPVLKVFKINGCAFAVKEERLSPESILLTETQLQNWRERKWAADFFRLKLRMSSLFFIGYGSEEPQVLHTIQNVFEENELGNDIHDNNIFLSTNAPVVSVYENNPSFVHEYITKQYCLYNGYNISDAEKLLITPDKVNNSENNLPADKLIEIIYQKILKQLIKDAILYSSKPQNASFTAFIPFAEKHLKYIVNHISFFDPIIKLYYKINDIPYPLIILMLNYLERKQDENTSYIPISENKELVAELLFTLFCLYCQPDNQSGLKDIKIGYPNFNALMVYKDNKNKYYFSSIPICIESNNLSKTEGLIENYKVVFLIGKNNFKYKANKCLIKVVGKSNVKLHSHYKMIIFQINYKTIFTYCENKNINVNSIEKIRIIIKDAIKRPSKYIASDRSSIRDKLKPYKLSQE